MTLAVTVTGTAAARAGAVLAWIGAGRHTKSQDSEGNVLTITQLGYGTTGG